MTTEVSPDIVELTREAHFRSEDDYVFRGRRHRRGHPRARFFTTKPGSPVIVADAGQRFYDGFYTRPRVPAVGVAEDRCSERDFVAALRASREGRRSRSSGWRVIEKAPDARLRVQRVDGTERTVAVERFEYDDGEIGTISIPSVLTDLQTGFVYALGTTDIPSVTIEPWTRVYFNITRQGALRLFSTLCEGLDDAGVPFRFKTVTDPQGYRRADAAVLYLPTGHYERAAPVLARTWHEMNPWLAAAAPAFTKQVAHGMGVAVDPGQNTSFGIERCQAVAEGLWRAHAAGVEDPEDRLRVVCEHFAKLGVDPARPYLAGGGRDPY